MPAARKTLSTRPAPQGREKRPGRPALPPSERRSHRVEVFLSPDEFARVTEAAAAAAMAPPAFLRSAALGVRVRARAPVADAKLSGDLKRIGNLFDQLARAANSGRVVIVKPDDLAALSGRLDDLAARLLLGPDPGGGP